MSDNKNNLSENISTVIARFDKRTKELKWNAKILLGFVVVILMLGIAIIIFASEITKIDISFYDQYQRTLEKRNKLEKELKDIRENAVQRKDQLLIDAITETGLKRHHELAVKIEEILLSCNTSTIIEKHFIPTVDLFNSSFGRDRQILQLFPEIQMQLRGQYALHSGEKLFKYNTPRESGECFSKVPKEILEESRAHRYKVFVALMRLLKENTTVVETKYIENKIKILDAESDKYITHESPKQDVISDNNPELSNWKTLIQTNITRFGSLIILLFLANVLLSQYRYNIRLSGFYEARADALILLDSQELSINYQELVCSLTPTYEIGKIQNTPIEQAIEMLKVINDKHSISKT